jgi:hypothetical protein
VARPGTAEWFKQQEAAAAARRDREAPPIERPETQAQTRARFTRERDAAVAMGADPQSWHTQRVFGNPAVAAQGSERRTARSRDLWSVYGYLEDTALTYSPDYWCVRWEGGEVRGQWHLYIRGAN